MSKLRYSVIFGEIRPEISERISLGIIIYDGRQFKVRYSEKKLKLLKSLFTEKEYAFVSKMIRTLSKNELISSESVINYLSRYSNNLVSVSKLQSIDVEASEKNIDWLYNNYVYRC